MPVTRAKIDIGEIALHYRSVRSPSEYEIK